MLMARNLARTLAVEVSQVAPAQAAVVVKESSERGRNGRSLGKVSILAGATALPGYRKLIMVT